MCVEGDFSLQFSENNINCFFNISRWCPGDSSVVEPPDPIPNSEVKGDSADDSVGATLRENTSSPGHCLENKLRLPKWSLFY